MKALLTSECCFAPTELLMRSDRMRRLSVGFLDFTENYIICEQCQFCFIPLSLCAWVSFTVSFELKSPCAVASPVAPALCSSGPSPCFPVCLQPFPVALFPEVLTSQVVSTRSAASFRCALPASWPVLLASLGVCGHCVCLCPGTGVYSRLHGKDQLHVKFEPCCR